MKAPHRSYLFLLSSTRLDTTGSPAETTSAGNPAYKIFSFAADFRLELVFVVFPVKQRMAADMFEFFPGNYRWSYNTLLAFAAGGQLGDVALILPRLQTAVGDDEAWHREWSWLGTALSRRAESGS